MKHIIFRVKEKGRIGDLVKNWNPDPNELKNPEIEARVERVKTKLCEELDAEYGNTNLPLGSVVRIVETAIDAIRSTPSSSVTSAPLANAVAHDQDFNLTVDNTEQEDERDSDADPVCEWITRLVKNWHPDKPRDPEVEVRVANVQTAFWKKMKDEYGLSRAALHDLVTSARIFELVIGSIRTPPRPLPDSEAEEANSLVAAVEKLKADNERQDEAQIPENVESWSRFESWCRNVAPAALKPIKEQCEASGFRIHLSVDDRGLDFIIYDGNWRPLRCLSVCSLELTIGLMASIKLYGAGIDLTYDDLSKTNEDWNTVEGFRNLVLKWFKMEPTT